MSRKSSLAVTSAFSLPREVDDLFLSFSRRRKLVDGEAVFPLGSAPLGMFRVLNGSFQVTKPSISGRHLYLATLTPADWFGEVALLDGLPRHYDVRAMSAAEIAFLPEHAFRKVIEERPDILLSVARLVCSRFRMAVERVESTALTPLPCRLASLLINLLNEPLAADSSAGLRVSQESIAKRLGVSRQAVNRQLKIWEKDGFLKVQYGLVTLENIPALQKACLSD